MPAAAVVMGAASVVCAIFSPNGWNAWKVLVVLGVAAGGLTVADSTAGVAVFAAPVVVGVTVGAALTTGVAALLTRAGVICAAAATVFGVAVVGWLAMNCLITLTAGLATPVVLNTPKVSFGS